MHILFWVLQSYITATPDTYLLPAEAAPFGSKEISDFYRPKILTILLRNTIHYRVTFKAMYQSEKGFTQLSDRNISCAGMYARAIPLTT